MVRRERLHRGVRSNARRQRRRAATLSSLRFPNGLRRHLVPPLVRAMSEWRIPFNRADLTGEELRYVSEAVAHGHLSGDGPFGRRCEELLENALGAERALLTSSCTHALELSALLLDVGPDDEVIVPAFTFVTTAAAFALRGARIVFADIRPDTLNLDEE